jgi:hypothetical protein
MTLQTFILLLPSFALAFTLIVWVLYLAIMSLRLVRDQGRLPKAVEPYAKVIILAGLALDCIYNLTVGTIIFMDLPQELLLTDRLERYKYGSDKSNWRYAEACEWGDTFLDPYDYPDWIHLKP